jgi:hypothetical protein
MLPQNKAPDVDNKTAEGVLRKRQRGPNKVRRTWGLTSEKVGRQVRDLQPQNQ